MNKPTLYLCCGAWYCADLNAPSPRLAGKGDTPKEAYEDWARAQASN